jgi:hypothetical protein
MQADFQAGRYSSICARMTAHAREQFAVILKGKDCARFIAEAKAGGGQLAILSPSARIVVSGNRATVYTPKEKPSRLLYVAGRWQIDAAPG